MTGQAIADFVGWVSGRGAAARPTPAGRQAGETHTACALRLIEAYGELSTVELRRLSGLSSAQLWGLLKTHRHSGRVDFRNGAWSWNARHVPVEEARAAELLRERGWRVEAQEGMGAR